MMTQRSCLKVSISLASSLLNLDMDLFALSWKLILVAYVKISPGLSGAGEAVKPEPSRTVGRAGQGWTAGLWYTPHANRFS